MLKRDRIFYSACALVLIGGVLAAMGQDISILFFVGAYLLRPALHEFGGARQYADERQKTIHSRAGNIAFISVILIAVGLAIWKVAKGERAEDLYQVIALGIAIRALTGLVMNGAYRRAGVLIVAAIGLFFGLFVAVSVGMPVGLIPGVLIFGAGALLAWLADHFPRPFAFVLAALCLLLIFGGKLYDFRAVNTALWLFLVAPLATGSACLFLGSGKDADDVSPRRRVTVFGSLGGGAALIFTLLVIFGARAEKAETAAAGGDAIMVEGIPTEGIVDYYKDGSLESCTLARLDTINGQPLAKGTVLHFTKEGDFNWCFLQSDTEIQGHLCQGSGHNFMTGFHPNGQLRLAWLERDEIIDSIPCKRFTFWEAVLGNGGGTHFHENGRLMSATLSEDITIQGFPLEEGDPVRFDSTGVLITDD